MDRFWSKVEKTESCWLWKGRLDHKGYGQFDLPDTTISAHRYSWQHLRGPVPDGLQLDHLCRIRKCVNPDHLEPVTARENIFRGVGLAVKHSKQTHCHKGHPFSGNNVDLVGNRGKYVMRVCVTCRNIRSRGYKAAKRAQLLK